MTILIYFHLQTLRLIHLKTFFKIFNIRLTTRHNQHAIRFALL